MIPALRRQRQVDPYEIEASLVYKVSSRTVRATQRNHVSNKTNKQNKTKQKQKIGGLVRLSNTHIHDSICVLI